MYILTSYQGDQLEEGLVM